MPKPIDMTGQTFGVLYVEGLAPKELWPRTRPDKRWSLRSWLCRCACGKVIVVPTAKFRCKTWPIQSCGCTRRKHMRELGRKACSHAIPKTCPHCKQEFLGTAKQIYCSRECKEAYELVERHDWNCESCGQPLKARQGQRYCNDRCKSRGRRASPLTSESVLTATTKLTERGDSINDDDRQDTRDR